jgi:hypothetical protein
VKDLFVGPFGPVVGYGLALINVAFLLRTMATGSVSVWRAPADIGATGLVRVASIMNVVAIVILWLFAAPERIKPMAAIAAACAVGFLLAFLTYRQLIVAWTVSDAHGKDYLGGTRLTKQAQKHADHPDNPVSTQALFAGAQYHPELVWTPSSLAWTRTIVTSLLLSLLTTATIALSSAGFLAQVTLTNKRAAAVIDVNDAPGSDRKRAAAKSPD